MVQPTQVFRRQRLKVSKACQACRSRKAKCDGNRPVCARCQAGRRECNYNRPGPVAVAVGGTADKPAPRQVELQHVPVLASPPSSPANSYETSSISTVLTPNTLEPPCPFSDPLGNGRVSDQDPSDNRAFSAAHGRFAGQVAAAIDERAGVPPATSYLVPFVDAPLFGDLNLPTRCSTLSMPTELPCRAHADRLVGIYWHYIDPAEPILDRNQFSQYYATSFSTSDNLSPRTIPQVRLAILNLVFALAVQRQECIPFGDRDNEGNIYFRRAWALLPAESILWEPGSLERVQCLMLMNRYLHCTNNQQKTWMTAGLAMRIAQSMCCHFSEAPTKDVSDEARLKRKVWASCVALDRCVLWSLGKTSVLALVPLSTGCYKQEDEPADHSRLKLELHEIGNQVQLAQIQTRNTLADRSAIPRLDQQEEYHTAAVHLDACLNKWEASLPNDLQLHNLKYLKDKTSQMERYMLHLRLLHARIYLYRPLLARFYSMKSVPQSKSNNASSLNERLLKECARMCVDAARGVTSLIIETLDHNQPIGILPWWTRVYYLHIAGVIFLAAMVGSELFTDAASQSWQAVLAALRAHIHLSTYVQQCVWTFEALSAKISRTTCPPIGSEGEPPTEGAGCCFDNIFQDIRFDFDEFLFRTEEVVDFNGLI